MRVVLQRVRCAKVEVGGEAVSEIGPGLLVLWGIEAGDSWTEADYLLRKVLKIKLWNDDEASEVKGRETGVRVAPSDQSAGKKTWSRSVVDNGFEILVVSQFTLFGTVKAGNKPDFHRAMAAAEASPFFDEIVAKLQAMYAPEKVKKGSFGSFMQVSLTNDGPVTIFIESRTSTPNKSE